VRERTQNGKLIVCHIPTYYQQAGALTKVLSTKNFVRLREEVKVVDGGGNEIGNPSSN